MSWAAAGGPRAAIAAALGLGGGVRMMRSVEEAITTADRVLPGFAARDAAVAEDGRAAIALAADGRVAVVALRGRRPVARVIAWTEVRQTYDGLVVEAGARGSAVLVRGVTALDARRLGMGVEA
jgi:hypothetical protein